MGSGLRTGSLVLGSVAVVSLIAAIGFSSSSRQGDIPQELLDAGAEQYASCIELAKPVCHLQLPTGRLTLTNIEFPDGEDEAGKAFASGHVGGRFVYGEVKLNAGPKIGTFVRAEPGNETHTLSPDEVADLHRENQHLNSQYTRAVKTMVSNIQSRQQRMKLAAEQVAQSVTKVLTSSAVSSTIANMALGVAETRAKMQDDGSILKDILPGQEHAKLRPAKKQTLRILDQGQSWNKAMNGIWKEDGVVQSNEEPIETENSKEDDALLPTLAEKTISKNPAAGVAGPPAGSFGSSSLQTVQTVTCAACLVCPGCCESGLVPGCRGYNESAAEYQMAGVGPSSDQSLNYQTAFDQGEVQAIDDRLAQQYQQMMGDMLVKRRKNQERRVKQRLKDVRETARWRQWRQEKQEKKQLNKELKKAEALPLQKIAEPTYGGLGDVWSQYRAYQTKILGHDPTLSAKYA